MKRAQSQSSRYLICASGAQRYALALEHVVETMRPQPLRSLAAMPAFLLGVSIIRGSATPIVAAALLLDANSNAPPTRFVTLRVGERRVGLAVERVIGVHPLPDKAVEDVPPLLRDARRDTISAVATLDAELLLVLQSARLLPETLWQSIDAEPPQP